MPPAAPGLTSMEGHPAVPGLRAQDGLVVVEGALHGTEGHRAAGAALRERQDGAPAGWGGRSPAGPGPGPAMPCHDPRALTWSWQSRYCRGSPVHGSSSVDLRPQRQRGGDGARPPRAALPAPCVPHGDIPHLRGQDAAEPPSCSRVGSDASPRGSGSGDHDVPRGATSCWSCSPGWTWQGPAPPPPSSIPSPPKSG